MRIEYNNGYYIGDVNHNEELHGRGKFVWDDGCYYDGEWNNDKKHGRGKYVWNNGDYYDGEWYNDKKHGRGKYVCNDGLYYDGEWRNGEIYGQCYKRTYSDGAVYTGRMAYGKRNGQGKCVYQDGSYYDGEWCNDKQQGQGKLVFANGNYYVGNFLDDHFFGKGTWYQDHRTVSYEGNWIDDENATDVTETDHGKKRHGKIVNNNFKADPLNGYARADYDNGYYEGNFSDGKRHGKGIYQWTDGGKYDGYWQYGDRHGYGIRTYGDGSIYDGMWSNNRWEGRGRLTHLNGHSYEGFFKGDQYCGQGSYTDDEGNRFEGTWASNGNADPVTLFVNGMRPQKGKLIDWEFIPDETGTSTYIHTNRTKVDEKVQQTQTKHPAHGNPQENSEKAKPTKKGNNRTKADLTKKDKSIIENYLRTKCKLDSDQIQQELRRFDRHPDIGAELSETLKNGRFPEENQVSVCVNAVSYTASMLYKKRYAHTIYGAYRRLAQLREHPELIEVMKKKAKD